MFRKFLMWLLIPRGMYCADSKYMCPFYFKICGRDDSSYCSYVGEDTVTSEIDILLLSDQCKICGKKY